MGAEERFSKGEGSKRPVQWGQVEEMDQYVRLIRNELFRGNVVVQLAFRNLNKDCFLRVDLSVCLAFYRQLHIAGVPSVRRCLGKRAPCTWNASFTTYTYMVMLYETPSNSPCSWTLPHFVTAQNTFSYIN